MVDFTACPRCGAALEDGFINPGVKVPFRWDTGEPKTTIFGGERLVDWPLVSGSQRLPAQRCRSCKLVLFEASSDPKIKLFTERQ